MAGVICSSCSAELAANARFCTTCGAKVPPPREPEPVAASDSDRAIPEPEVAEPEAAASPAAPSRTAAASAPAPAVAARRVMMSGRIAYDPAVIQTYADALYSAADRIVFTSTLIGAAIGGALGFGVGKAMEIGAFGALIGAAAGGYIGYSRALARTFQLRLEAQLALCQVEIEMNTRELLE